MADNKQATNTPAISLPKGGGAIKGIGETFQPNLFTGTGNFSIPIAISPGRNGFGPKLTLQYSTGNGNGPFGLGWQISIPRITRKTEKGLPEYKDKDVFVMSGAEDLVAKFKSNTTDIDTFPHDGYTITRYRPRTEGLFAKIEKWVKNEGNVHWRGTTKENVTSIYGKSPSARIVDPDHSDHIFEWLLEETFDAKGNHILYEYLQDDPDQKIDGIQEQNRRYTQAYIRRILYGNTPDSLRVEKRAGPVRENSTNHISNNAIDTIPRHYVFEVLFDYFDLPDELEPGYDWRELDYKVIPHDWPDPALRRDPFSSYRSGFEIRTLRLCKRVLMLHHFNEEELLGAPLVKSTDFEYENNKDTKLSMLTAAKVVGYRKNPDPNNPNKYLSRDLPPVSFIYSEFKPKEQKYKSVNAKGNDFPPAALNNPDFTLMDIYGNGLPDILQTTRNGYYVWQNLGDAKIDRRHPQHDMPAGVVLSDKNVAIGDMGGDGLPDLIVDNPPVSGFYEATPDGNWKSFHQFDLMPTLGLNDPNARMVDLTGDGLSDILVTRDTHFLFYKSKGEKGYEQPQSIARRHNLDEFPDVYFNDPSGRVRLADMTGDGLSDIVLLHYGKVEYWPNLGYGKFGSRIIMKDTPRLEYNFDPQRLFLADLDGSGSADLVYVDLNSVHFWFNQSGNSWSKGQIINGTPRVNNLSTVQFADFYGAGTSCLAWSYNFDQQPDGNYKVLDFCGGVKPYLLTEMSNNMGATTKVQYASSTKFYLDDKKEGKPWVTNLPFPVQVLEKTEVIDHISKTKLVTTYKYHHGYFDGKEREFRGFGKVDQMDTEFFKEFSENGLHREGTEFCNKEQAYHVPPVLTRNWFHTGVYFDENLPSASGVFYDKEDMMAAYRKEYYSGDQNVFQMGDHEVKVTETPHEAYRILRGSLIRSEVYALDGIDKAAHPYMVTENKYKVMEVQPKDVNNHGVYLATLNESLSYYYEREPNDPRIVHKLNIERDEFGNELKSVSISYPRRDVNARIDTLHGLSEEPARERELRDKLKAEQGRYLFTYNENEYVTTIDFGKAFLHSMPWDMKVFELTGVPLPTREIYTKGEIKGIFNGANSIEYEDRVSVGQHKRLVDQKRVRYWKDDLSGPQDFGEAGNLGLQYESYQLAFTPSLLQNLYQRKVNEAMLDKGGYTLLDGKRWIPSGKTLFDDTKFYINHRYVDPFQNETKLYYDDYALLMTRIDDAIDNSTIVLPNDGNNYRVLQPQRIKGPNQNVSEVAFDALGMVVGASIRGHSGEGDSLIGFETDVDNASISDSLNQANTLLGSATERIVYNLNNYYKNSQPNFVHTIAREIHQSDLDSSTCPLRHTFLYSDGFSREVQTKTIAESEQGSCWLSSGSKVYNNKGKPVQQYEPFYSNSHLHSLEHHGVSSTLFYDPLERVIATINPNHTYSKVVFTAWHQATWDENDTLRLKPHEDTNTKGYVGDFIQTYRHPLDNRSFKTWYEERINDHTRSAEMKAATQTEVHANTPNIDYLDALGRTILSITDNSDQVNNTEEKLSTIIELDIEGNDISITDPRSIKAFIHGFDIAGRKVIVDSKDAGHKILFPDVTNSPLYMWDANENEVYSKYDKLRRPTEVWVKSKGSAKYFLAVKTEYGESLGTTSHEKYHCMQTWKTYDGAGLQENVVYDFKGNPIETRRILLIDCTTPVQWALSRNPDNYTFHGETAETRLLESGQSFISKTDFDALNRPIRFETPDKTVQISSYNRTGLLKSLLVSDKEYIEHIYYNPKGLRTEIKYGNNVTTKYIYDDETFRLSQITSKRRGNQTPKELQQLKYAYDPVGNITEIHDDAHPGHFYRNNLINPVSNYIYDSVYRLIKATGREHEAMTLCHYREGGKKNTEFIHYRARQPISNGQAICIYKEKYAYDKSGNITLIDHHNLTLDIHTTRVQKYDTNSNRIKTSKAGCTYESTFNILGKHDANGNLESLPHLQANDPDDPALIWNFKNQLVEVQLNRGTNPNKAYYQYDAGGQRVRKKVVKNGKTEESIYIGGYEVYTESDSSGTTLRRDTIHVMDDKNRIAIIDIKKVPSTGNSVPNGKRVRYQLSNHIGSGILEVDASPNAKVISYEEYYPYGGTAFIAGRDWNETKLKRYRYSGKERDDETGLYYYGARYYAPWMGRWLGCDPGGTVDGWNLYVYGQGNPIILTDKGGYRSDLYSVNNNNDPQIKINNIDVTHGDPDRLPGNPEPHDFTYPERDKGSLKTFIDKGDENHEKEFSSGSNNNLTYHKPVTILFEGFTPEEEKILNEAFNLATKEYITGYSALFRLQSHDIETFLFKKQYMQKNDFMKEKQTESNWLLPDVVIEANLWSFQKDYKGFTQEQQMHILSYSIIHELLHSESRINPNLDYDEVRELMDAYKVPSEYKLETELQVEFEELSGMSISSGYRINKDPILLDLTRGFKERQRRRRFIKRLLGK